MRGSRERTYRLNLLLSVQRDRRDLICRERLVPNEGGRWSERWSRPGFGGRGDGRRRDETRVGAVRSDGGRFEVRRRVRLMLTRLGGEERVEGSLLLPVLLEATLHRRLLLLLLMLLERRLLRLPLLLLNQGRVHPARRCVPANEALSSLTLPAVVRNPSSARRVPIRLPVVPTRSAHLSHTAHDADLAVRHPKRIPRRR